jgi:hypothetical protein
LEFKISQSIFQVELGKNIQENRRYVARKMAKNCSIGQKQAKMGQNSNFAGAVAHY